VGPRIEEWLDGLSGLGFLVPDYALMMAAAIVGGAWLAVHRAEAARLDGRRVFLAALAAIAGALVGARLLFVLLHPEAVAPGALRWLRFWDNGLTSSGALAGGAGGLLLASRALGLPTGRLLDAAAPAVAAAFALGRTGCFLAGCCFGGVSSLPWAVRFPEGSPAHLAQVHAGLVAPGEAVSPVHPTQLYEVALALAVLALLLRLPEGWAPSGARFALLFTLYPLGRLGNELLRGDDRGALGPLSVPQAVALAALAGSLALWLRARREPGATRTVEESPS
jgi:phosphatidylglycerol:prolipoprotein diacylglycerol transferase